MKSVLDNFKVVGANPDCPFVSITENGVAFSKQAIDLLGYPEYVTLLVNEESRQFAIQPCEESYMAQAFLKKGRNAGRAFVRWNNKNVIKPILDMLPDNVDANGVRVNGIYYKEENCIIFDCKRTDALTRGKK